MISFIHTLNMKMSEKKYYKPDLSEFHTGFEYEMNGRPCMISKEQPYYDWMDFEDLSNGGPVLLRKYSVPDGCLVKYLDKEDIESLDWEPYLTNDSSGIVLFGGDPFILKGFILEASYFTVKTKGAVMVLIRSLDSKRTMRGYGIEVPPPSMPVWIKNKSELKRLMNQIGI